MATLRTLTIIGVAAFAGLAFTVLPGRSAQVGAPLSLAPLAYSDETPPQHSAKPRKSRRATRHHRTAPRSAARSRAEQRADERADQNVIQVPSGVSLTSLLPWWHSDKLEAVRYQDRKAQSPILSAADAWFAALGVEKVTPVESDDALASTDDVNELDLAASGMTIADSGEVNAIDLAADSEDNSQSKSWLNILLASLGGALAVASTARFLFV